MREYYEKRALEYDDWWLGTGQFAARPRRAGPRTSRRWARCCARWRRRGRSISRAGPGSSRAGCRGSWSGSTRARRWSRSRSARRPDASFVQGDALEPRPGFERIFSGHFYGHLDAAQRERFLALPGRDELVIVDSALRPDGVAEDWQERVLDDGSRHSVYKRWFTAERAGRGDRRRRGPARRAVVRRRQRFEPALLNDAPWLRSPSAKWGGSAVPSFQAVVRRSAIAGPCLKPWPEPPPTIQCVGVLGVRRGDEVRVGRDLVAAALRADQRRLRERGEAVGGVAAASAARSRPWPAGGRRRGPAAGPRRPTRPSRRARRCRRCRRSRGRSRPSRARRARPARRRRRTAPAG